VEIDAEWRFVDIGYLRVRHVSLLFFGADLRLRSTPSKISRDRRYSRNGLSAVAGSHEVLPSSSWRAGLKQLERNRAIGRGFPILGRLHGGATKIGEPRRVRGVWGCYINPRTVGVRERSR
jgi:predicted lysophospholipase L1 biosynthesis ABC-type transport system permease subunit